jgi:thioredoxin reductase (NADPH)
MSSYLIDRITATRNIEVVTGAEIAAVEGHDGILEAVRWQRKADDREDRVAARHLFLFIGADPHTDWLAGSAVKLDGRGFIETGVDIGQDRLPLETSRRGIFAIGDVRSGSVKRVAAAAGDGAQVVAALHAHLAKLDRTVPAEKAQRAQLEPVADG